jgi:hypothetical protein
MWPVYYSLYCFLSCNYELRIGYSVAGAALHLVRVLKESRQQRINTYNVPRRFATSRLLVHGQVTAGIIRSSMLASNYRPFQHVINDCADTRMWDTHHAHTREWIKAMLTAVVDFRRL